MNRITCFFAVVLCIALLTAPFSVYADEGYSLTLNYSKEGIIFSDLEINIYRIADPDFNKIAPFDIYPVQIKEIASQIEWSEAAVTLRSYIGADSLEPYMTGNTDDEGSVIFSGMEQGLYLVCGVRAEKEGRIYTFYDFMILVTESVTAKPKSGVDEPTDGEKIYTVLKLWKDNNSEERPASVTVDIFKDGILRETVILDSVNNWSYTFNTDSAGKWTVVERDVPEGYFVVITEKETSFIITNTLYNTNPDDGTPGKNTGTDTGTPGGSKPVTPGTNAPQTGDTFPMKRYMIMLCVSGMMLVVLGFGMRRKDDAKGR